MSGQAIGEGMFGDPVNPTGPGGGPVPVSPPANRPAFSTDQKDVATPGVGVNLPDLAVPNGFALVIVAKPLNAGLIYLGNSKANAENPAVADILARGDFRRLYITNANLGWIDADNADEGVTLIVET